MIAYQIKEEMGIVRTGKQCRERWLNHLRPNIDKGHWTIQEEEMIKYYYNAFGPK
jgi:myb proto-oncogene protein